jgi:uncharacterized protein (TIGR02246 family)
MKIFRILFTVSAVSLLILPSCQRPQVDIQAEKDAIRELSGTWRESVRNKNVEGMINLLASDVIFMVDDLPIIEGKESIREAQQAFYEDTSIDFSTFQVEVKDIQISGSGDMAWDRVEERFMQRTPEGMKEQRSKWIDIWKKEGGQWKAVVVIGNQDNP